MPKLAINGGTKVRKKKFPPYDPLGKEEEKAVHRVFHSKVFSKFLGAWHEDFYGGPEVRMLEKKWAKYFGAKHAVAVNSATSGLYAAVGAAGLGPGDEVIVSPYTMSASVVAPLIFNAIPVFADIEEDYFCISPKSIEEKITSRTKAIIAVDIFGQPYNAAAINRIARKNGLIVIEDAAQAPGASYGKKYAGTLGDMGVFSLNYHKHIHTGEGGIVVTDKDDLADRLRLIRNHAEAVVGAKGCSSLVDLIGFNFRMTELEAAMAQEQLKKLKRLVDARINNVKYINKELKPVKCLVPAPVRPGCKHSFYLHTFKYDSMQADGVTRNKFIDAVKAELTCTERRESEGVKVSTGYVKPLYLQPLFQKRIAYGKNGCPWNCDKYSGSAKYDKGICPVAEKMHEKVLVTHELMHANMSRNDLHDVARAFLKVWENRKELL